MMENIQYLEDRLRNHENSFNSIANLIPAKYYLPVDPKVVQAKFMKNSKKRKAEAEIKWKKTMPLSQDEIGRHKTVQEVIEEKQLENDSEPKLEVGIQDLDSNTELLTKSVPQITPTGTMKATSIEDLRSRLNDRIEQLRQNRSSKKNSGSDANQTKESILQNRLKRKKDLEEKSKNKDKMLLVPQHSGGNKDGNRDPDSHKKKKQKALVKDEISYGNIDTKKKKPVSKDAKLTHQQALEKINKKKEKIEQIEKRDPELAKKIKDEQIWKSAIEKAQGVKTKDNEKLLTKSIKRIKQQKNKSAKQWKDRATTVKKSIEEKQEKRTKNIKAKIEAKKNKKLGIKTPKKASKKARPGFEGKQSSKSKFKKQKK
ncbi:hypothetical protein BB558_005091 [Smittium angustum]|uniref:Ribosomal RNA-processing protein 14/surfeit locus protein 6 C-terminal domain-containing protein n=1 Tax=Smittium angustum TaxID=133377 RepID=A0A2U1J1D6_SMIAN|nr:hypothetical protein BB558_005091 [Smittium angustum]